MASCRRKVPRTCSPEGNPGSEAVAAIEGSPAEEAKCEHSPRTSCLAASDTAASGSRPHSSRNSRRTSRSIQRHLVRTCSCTCRRATTAPSSSRRRCRRSDRASTHTMTHRPTVRAAPVRGRHCPRPQPRTCIPEGNRGSEAEVPIEDSPAQEPTRERSPRTSSLAAEGTADIGSRSHSSRSSRRTS